MSIYGSGCTENELCERSCDAKSSAIISQKKVESFIREAGRGLWNVESSSQQWSVLHEDVNLCESSPRKRRQVERVDNNSQDGQLEALVTDKRALLVEGHGFFAGMLEWVKRLALNPGDLKKGQGPRGSKQSESWVEMCSAQWDVIRGLLWKKKNLMPGFANGYSGSSMKQKLPPALYYKELPKPDKQILEKLRLNQIRALRCGLDPSAYTNSYLVHPRGANWAPVYPSQALADMGNLEFLIHGRGSRKRVPVGSDFQAQVPPWIPREKLASVQNPGAIEDVSSRMTYTSDSDYTRLLDTVVWPCEEIRHCVNKVRIGEGRPLGCSCMNPNSVDCVALHVHRESERLKLELREAFDALGFNDMGEAVSNLWTKEEELAFKMMVRTNSFSSGRDFWAELPSAFPSKSMKELVSYYFNVFILRCRAIQNRMMPELIDSDDDEIDLPERSRSLLQILCSRDEK